MQKKKTKRKPPHTRLDRRHYWNTRVSTIWLSSQLHSHYVNDANAAANDTHTHTTRATRHKLPPCISQHIRAGILLRVSPFHFLRRAPTRERVRSHTARCRSKQRHQKWIYLLPGVALRTRTQNPCGTIEARHVTSLHGLELRVPRVRRCAATTALNSTQPIYAGPQQQRNTCVIVRYSLQRETHTHTHLKRVKLSLLARLRVYIW